MHTNETDASPGLKYFVVDAFADRPFAGNPAAVVPLDDCRNGKWPSDRWLQQVAMELNLSETAFLAPRDDGYRLRWFTPAVEVELCGHATLAAAKALAYMGRLPDGDEVAFSTLSGVLRASRKGNQISLDFPVKQAEKVEPPAGLLEALGLTQTQYVGRSQFDYLVEVAAAEEVRSLSPDFRRLAEVECRGVIVTAASDDRRFDFMSRFFAPAAGIDEDPVTGSAHCVLADHWASRLGKTTLTAYQASRRGGVLSLTLAFPRVHLAGPAVMVAEGRLLLTPE